MAAANIDDNNYRVTMDDFLVRGPLLGRATGGAVLAGPGVYRDIGSFVSDCLPLPSLRSAGSLAVAT